MKKWVMSRMTQRPSRTHRKTERSERQVCSKTRWAFLTVSQKPASTLGKPAPKRAKLASTRAKLLKVEEDYDAEEWFPSQLPSLDNSVLPYLCVLLLVVISDTFHQCYVWSVEQNKVMTAQGWFQLQRFYRSRSRASDTTESRLQNVLRPRSAELRRRVRATVLALTIRHYFLSLLKTNWRLYCAISNSDVRRAGRGQLVSAWV